MVSCFGVQRDERRSHEPEEKPLATLDMFLTPRILVELAGIMDLFDVWKHRVRPPVERVIKPDFSELVLNTLTPDLVEMPVG